MGFPPNLSRTSKNNIFDVCLGADSDGVSLSLDGFRSPTEALTAPQLKEKHHNAVFYVQKWLILREHSLVLPPTQPETHTSCELTCCVWGSCAAQF